MGQLIHLRHFSSEEMADIAERLEAKARAGRVAHLRPTTAFLASQGVRRLVAAPTHAAFQSAFCRKHREGKCSGNDPLTCFQCLGLANAAMAMLRGE